MKRDREFSPFTWDASKWHFNYRGGPLERGLRRVVNDIPIGSLLIQSDPKTGEPLLLHSALPISVRERHRAENAWVFLLDSQVCSMQLFRLLY